MDALCGRFDISAIPEVVAGGRFTETEGAAVFSGGNVYIGDDVKMTGGVILGANTSIGSDASLHDCIIMEGAEVPAFAEIKNCIVSPSFFIDMAAAGKAEETPRDNVIPFAAPVRAAAIHNS